MQRREIGVCDRRVELLTYQVRRSCEGVDLCVNGRGPLLDQAIRQTLTRQLSSRYAIGEEQLAIAQANRDVGCAVHLFGAVKQLVAGGAVKGHPAAIWVENDSADVGGVNPAHNAPGQAVLMDEGGHQPASATHAPAIRM